MILQQQRMTERVNSLVKLQGKRRSALFTFYFLRLNCERELFFTKLVCDYAVAIVGCGNCRRLQGHSHVVVGGLHL